MPSAGPEELDTRLDAPVAMTSDLSLSTPQRPRAATSTLPAMPQLPTLQQSLRGPRSAHGGSPPLGSNEQEVTRSAQGPLRHPKPLTPSDLHLVLEKEQEAMVNRLTRELSLLRQQTASVASTTSSTSTLNESTEGVHGSPSLTGSTNSLSSRRQRSSSSLGSHAPSVHGSQASVTGIAPSRTADPHRSTRSREPSLSHRRPSVGSLSSYTQHPHPDHIAHYGSPSIYPHRNSVSQTHLGLSSSSLARCEEVATHRSELETARRENEQLRRRVRELEQILKKQKERPADS
ncbi:uncharacterized protein N7484_008395 [Penicillium longicatenatum]|uniref:uncharacterized protein n=1 Tax=Penicillium longicatenatum TaxID=1561947 RepID=UPI002546EDE7|nr:uncharacterized protein N7484_008395 [Penicillium longicatenatum]KAJ5635082.1 hypothetical protein N7484_008395 [Penicillium longicatenatum]